MTVTAIITAMTDGEREFLDDAVDSVIAEPEITQVVLCVRDTNHWLKRYQGVEVLRLPPLRAGAARNRGVAAARNDWIAFCDGDDVWVPGKIARQLRAAATHHAIIVGCCHYLMDESGTVRASGFINQPMTSTWMIRRSVFDEFQFDESMIVAEDNNFWYRTRHLPRVRLAARCMKYRVRRGSLSSGLRGKERKQLLVDVARFPLVGKLIYAATWVRWLKLWRKGTF